MRGTLYLVMLVLQLSFCSLLLPPRNADLQTAPGNYRAGYLQFSKNMTSANATFKEVPLPTTILSICQLHFQRSFGLKFDHELSEPSQGNMTLRLNSQSFGRYTDYYFFKATVSYLVTQQLRNMQVQLFNLTSLVQHRSFAITQPVTPTLFYLFFLTGFSKYINTQSIQVLGPRQSGKNIIQAQCLNIARFDNTSYIEWVEIYVVVIDYTNNCERGSYEYMRNIHTELKGDHFTVDLNSYREFLFYIVGINRILSPKGNFTFSVKEHMVIVDDQTWIEYSAIGLNMTCMAEVPYLVEPQAEKQQQETVIREPIPINPANIFVQEVNPDRSLLTQLGTGAATEIVAQPVKPL